MQEKEICERMSDTLEKQTLSGILKESCGRMVDAMKNCESQPKNGCEFDLLGKEIAGVLMVIDLACLAYNNHNLESSVKKHKKEKMNNLWNLSGEILNDRQ